MPNSKISIIDDLAEGIESPIRDVDIKGHPVNLIL